MHTGESMHIRDWIVRTARSMACTTAMSCAFLRALGIETPPPFMEGGIIEVERYGEIKVCMANHGSPMEW